MASNYITIHQYEPLRTPSNWTGAERNLVRQISDTFDDLYRRLNRLRFEDMNVNFQKRIEDSEGNLSQIEQTAKSLVMTVSGGSHIWRQDTVPEPPDFNPLYGDLWYDTDDGDRCYKYEAGQWKLVSHTNVMSAIQNLASVTVTPETVAATVQSQIQTTIIPMIGYRVEILSDYGTVLTERIPQTVLTAQIMQGNEDVTAQIDQSRFHWTRKSADAAADDLWNQAHHGMKSITVGTPDVHLEATFHCDITEG